MKNLLIVVLLLGMTSCYNSRVCVGNATSKTPVVEVYSVKNHHLLYGLIPIGNNNLEAVDYIGGREDYVVKNNWTFVDGLLSLVTCGIYTPTTTTFYVPIDEISASSDSVRNTKVTTTDVNDYDDPIYTNDK